MFAINHGCLPKIARFLDLYKLLNNNKNLSFNQYSPFKKEPSTNIIRNKGNDQKCLLFVTNAAASIIAINSIINPWLAGGTIPASPETRKVMFALSRERVKHDDLSVFIVPDIREIFAQPLQAGGALLAWSRPF